MKNSFFFLLLIFLSCEHKTASLEKEESTATAPTFAEKSYEENYFEFKPDTISNVKIDGFDIRTSYKINGKKIVIGTYLPSNGNFSPHDSEADNGLRLLFLNEKNELLFKSVGQMDAFMFEPHFYKNKTDQKIIIVCQLAFEYFYGGEAFVFENGNIKHIGTLDVASTSEEINLIDMLQIHEIDKQLIFSFKADSLLLEPGSKDLPIKNDNTSYIFQNGSLKFYKKL